MNTFRLTPQAREDLWDIFDYLSTEAGDKQADRVIDEIELECNRLAEMPGLGHYREDLLDRNYRFWSVYSYVIAYRWNSSPIEIVAVVQGARNLETFFPRRKRGL